jgi:3-oxoacyl-[acyl-carrier-protein] synthase II
VSISRRRIVITGLGVIAPNGIGKDRFGTALLSGQSGIRQVPIAAHSELPCYVEARVTDFRFSEHWDPRRRNMGRSLSRVSEFALVSSQMALDDAGIDLSQLNPRRTGICYGTTVGKPDFYDDAVKFHASGVASLEPSAWAEFPPHAPASHIASVLGFSGPIATSSSGCCTGLMVMDWAAERIATGRLDTALVGSCDSLLSPLVLAAFGAGRLLTKQSDPAKAARPYDLHRDGLVPGEAAGALVLESLESALDRNAPIYAEYLGFDSTVDSYRTGKRALSGQGLSRAISGALYNAGLAPNQIDCINSHGLSHPVFDLIETQSFKETLGKAAYSVPITSIKSMVGASFAADGILQAISSCLILDKGVIPPTLNLETPDPACDLDYVTKPRAARVNHILTNTRALGGANAVLLLGRVDRGT